MINDTLSKIDEHLKTHTPRQSVVNPDRKLSATAAAAAALAATDSGSDYSSHVDHRLSYINGQETDEEENPGHTEQEVLSWSPDRVAEYLEDVGVQHRLCNVFRDQEVNGEVLLGMDQSQLFIKEFDLGPIGPRLRIWQKIKALQEEVIHTTAQISAMPRSISNYSGATGEGGYDPLRNRSSSMGTMLPRIPSVMDKPGARTSRHHSQHNTVSSTTQLPSARPDTQSTLSSISQSPKIDMSLRPSAASVRELQYQHRRASSFDPTNGSSVHAPSSVTTTEGGMRSPSNFRTHLKNQGSLDRGWVMNGEDSPNLLNGRRSFSQQPSKQSLSMTSDTGNFERDVLSNLHLLDNDRQDDLERGYFSGGEVDKRRSRNFLRKKDSPGHSRQSSHFKSEDQPSQLKSSQQQKTGRRRSASVAALTRHARGASHDSMRDAGRAIVSPAAQAYYSKGKRKDVKNPAHPELSSRQHAIGSTSPTVTKLDYGQSPTIDTVASSSPKSGEGDGSKSSRFGRTSDGSSFFSRPRTSGLRTVSDLVTGGGSRGTTNSPEMSSSTLLGSKDGALQPLVRKDSVDASEASQSLDLNVSEMTKSSTSGSLRSSTMPHSSQSQLSKQASQPSLNPSSAVSASTPTINTRRRAKSRASKKQISALAHGLEKKSPQEQIAGSDYSGWMKKKSSNLMATWKPRLFVLRGRRLSYYYTEADTEEKGLIDISGHRVLPANDERITGLHAQLTRAATSPTAPPSATNSTHSGTDSAAASPTATTHQRPHALNSPTRRTTNGSSQPPTPTSPSTPSSIYIFKLVPPRTALSKGVNFTRPSVHYFAVDSVATARYWMAALVKATIDHEVTGAPLLSTYQQKTVSLKEARAMRTRPPALMDEPQLQRHLEGVEKKRQEAERAALSPGQGGGVAALDAAAKIGKEKGLGEGLGLVGMTMGMMGIGTLKEDGEAEARAGGQEKP